MMVAMMMDHGLPVLPMEAEAQEHPIPIPDSDTSATGTQPFWSGFHLKRFRNKLGSNRVGATDIGRQAHFYRVLGPDAVTGEYKRLDENVDGSPPTISPLQRPSSSPSPVSSSSRPSTSTSAFSSFSRRQGCLDSDTFPLLSAPTPPSQPSPLPTQLSEKGKSRKMESQETLINPTPLALKFNKKSCTNVTIYQGTQPVYRITTNKDGTRTDVFDLAVSVEKGASEKTCSALITTIKRREFFPDVVKFRNRRECVKISKWLQKEKLPDGMGMTLDTTCGPLLWKYGRHERHRLALYTDKDADHPVAYLDCSRSRIPMVLVIEPGYQDLAEEILTSALVLEYKLKMFERIKKHDILYGPILGGLITSNLK